MTKQKAKYPQSEEEISAGVVVAGRAPVHTEAEGMEAAYFEDLLESVREAGAILRGEREAARRTRFDAADGSDPTQE